MNIANKMELWADRIAALIAYPFAVYVQLCVLEGVINDLLN